MNNMRKLYHVNTGDDIAEGMFDADGTLLGIWSPNDGYWSDYFNDFMKRLGFEVETICDWDHWLLKKLQRAAMEEWGLSEEEVGLE